MDRPAKDGVLATNCKEVGQLEKKTVLFYLAELMKKKKQVCTSISSRNERKQKQGSLYLYEGQWSSCKVEAICPRQGASYFNYFHLIIVVMDMYITLTPPYLPQHNGVFERNKRYSGRHGEYMLGKITLIFAKAVFAHTQYEDKEFNMVEDLWDFIHVIAPMLKKNPQEIRENVMTKSYKHGRLMAVHAIGFKESDLRIRVNDGCVFVKGEAKHKSMEKRTNTEPVVIVTMNSYESHTEIVHLLRRLIGFMFRDPAKRENQECVHVGWGDVMG
ncbi:hypothetical protein Tco_1174497 [Tanacetum coccineum]